jgi:hypothetical protein
MAINVSEAFWSGSSLEMLGNLETDKNGLTVI